MNKNKKIIISAGVFLAISLYIYIEKKFTSVGTSIFSFSFVLFLISCLLLFVRVETVKFWIKFAKFYLIISLAIILITPATGGLLNPDKELITLWLAGIFFITSIGVIIGKSLKLRKS